MPTLTPTQPSVQDVLLRYWGYDTLRPLQAEAIEAALHHRDSLVVLPTGGGKSLCYAVPPAVAGRTDVVVSPLIALMKDQVDGLTACGYPAAALHSGMTDDERRVVERGIAAGAYRLLFVAPERLLTPWFLEQAKRLQVRTFAIDEAHCISQWGHDFRPEYRRLATIKTTFPGATIHAYTATATERVRADIIAQLGLADAEVLVGTFDRPNLQYRVLERGDLNAQVVQVLQRHQGEAAIVYCISRDDTERLSAALRARGVRAAHYHAGMDTAARSKTQEAFAAEKLDVVVATVAFGMGIDRSNVRCVIHAALPKSVEQYQQETGRAGRDGLEAECVLFTAPADLARWERLLTMGGGDAANLAAQRALLRDMAGFASSEKCRHAALSGYFGQVYPLENCGACDVCLDERPAGHDGTDLARAVLQCVASLRVPFGVTYVAEVLTGARNKRILERGHEQLPEHGALRGMPLADLQHAIRQLVNQGLLRRTDDDRPVLTLTSAAQAVLSGDVSVTLSSSASAAATAAAGQDAGWEGVDRGLFAHLRGVRLTLAEERSVPAFVILGDATLRELARLRPATSGALAKVRGIGERKLADLGPRLVAAIAAYCREHGLSTDVPAQAAPVLVTARPKPAGPATGLKLDAYAMFERGANVEEVVEATGRALGTVEGYLEDFISERRPTDLSPWVDAATYRRVEATAKQIGGYALKPVFEALDGKVGYDVIRVVMRHCGLR